LLDGFDYLFKHIWTLELLFCISSNSIRILTFGFESGSCNGDLVVLIFSYGHNIQQDYIIIHAMAMTFESSNKYENTKTCSDPNFKITVRLLLL